MRRARVHLVPFAIALTLCSVGGCGLARRASRAAGGPAEYREPITLAVRNENFLDMTITVVSHGMNRRLGTAPGNTTSNFTIDLAGITAGDITVVATPIGGAGRASSGSLSVGEGQHIEFRVAQVLRQSAAIVR